MIVWAFGNDILQPLWYFSSSRSERNRISRYSKFLSTILCTFEQRNICFQLVFYFVSSNAISIFTHHFAKIQTPLHWMCSEYHILSQITKSVGKESAKQLQSTLGFATMDKAANLDLATARALTDLRQYINSNLVFSDLKFWPLNSDRRSHYTQWTWAKIV